jgi:cobalamin biosynthesis Mg chelatase CobN
MSRVDELLRMLEGRVGTARQIAEGRGLDSQDSSVKRALKKGLDDGRIHQTRVEHGPRKGEVVMHPERVASGFGGAITHGIERGTARSTAFARMSAQQEALRQTRARG